MEAEHDVAPVLAAEHGQAQSDYSTAPLERLRQTARTEIDRHVQLDGRCVICASPFPCDRAALAELALGLF